MKIILFTDSLGPGGAQRQLVGLGIMLKEKGYQVKVSTYYNIDFYKRQLDDSKVVNEIIPHADKTRKRLFATWSYFKKEKPDIVISYLETPSICACAARLFNHRYKLIVSERNTTQITDFKERARFNIFRLADYVVPNAFAQENYINKTFPFLSKKTFTIPNFVDLEHFVPPFERCRRTVPEIMVAASIWASKNTLGFIDAVAKLKKQGYKFHVSWYGKDALNKDYYEKSQHKIERLGICDVIELKEKTKAIREKYREADYFCLPSFYEGTPNVICEAMSCGLPVVCSDVCDNGRYVKDAENGFLFNPKDAESIAEAMEKMLLLNDNDYKKYCHNSRMRAEKMLSKEKFVQSYIKLIEQ